jgi:bacteriocin-like protein
MAVTAVQTAARQICQDHSMGEWTDLMATAISAAASSEQVREPTGELTEDELALVSGGKPSSNATMQSDVNPQ